jgi:hypothetical protein
MPFLFWSLVQTSPSAKHITKLATFLFSFLLHIKIFTVFGDKKT